MPLPAAATSLEIRQAQKRALYAILLYLVAFCLFLYCAVRGLVPVVYIVVLSAILTWGILAQLRSIYRLRSSLVSQELQSLANPPAESGERPEIWSIWGRIPVIVTRRNFPLFVIAVFILWLAVWIIGTWWRHQIQ